MRLSLSLRMPPLPAKSKTGRQRMLRRSARALGFSDHQALRIEGNDLHDARTDLQRIAVDLPLACRFGPPVRGSNAVLGERAVRLQLESCTPACRWELVRRRAVHHLCL